MCCQFSGEEHGVDAEFLNGVGRNGKANKALLCLIDDVGGIDAVIGEVVVVEPTSGEADAALVAAARIHGARHKGRKRRPVSAIQRQFSHLLRLGARAQRVSRLIQLQPASGDIYLLGNSAHLQFDVEGWRVPHSLLEVVDQQFLEAGRGTGQAI